jgi:Predicted integral membrane protein
MLSNRQRFNRYALPGIIWAGLIFIESSIPGSKFPSTPLGTDKLVHIAIFFIFCWLAFRAFSHHSSESVRALSLFLAAVTTIIYGFADEFHQLYVPGRSADIYDVAADAVGGFLFIGIALFLRWNRAKSTQEHDA